MWGLRIKQLDLPKLLFALAGQRGKTQPMTLSARETGTVRSGALLSFVAALGFWLGEVFGVS